MMQQQTPTTQPTQESQQSTHSGCLLTLTMFILTNPLWMLVIVLVCITLTYVGMGSTSPVDYIDKVHSSYMSIVSGIVGTWLFVVYWIAWPRVLLSLFLSCVCLYIVRLVVHPLITIKSTAEAIVALAAASDAVSQSTRSWIDTVRYSKVWSVAIDAYGTLIQDSKGGWERHAPLSPKSAIAESVEREVPVHRFVDVLRNGIENGTRVVGVALEKCEIDGTQLAKGDIIVERRSDDVCSLSCGGTKSGKSVAFSIEIIQAVADMHVERVAIVDPHKHNKERGLSAYLGDVLQYVTLIGKDDKKSVEAYANKKKKDTVEKPYIIQIVHAWRDELDRRIRYENESVEWSKCQWILFIDEYVSLLRESKCYSEIASTIAYINEQGNKYGIIIKCAVHEIKKENLGSTDMRHMLQRSIFKFSKESVDLLTGAISAFRRVADKASTQKKGQFYYHSLVVEEPVHVASLYYDPKVDLPEIERIVAERYNERFLADTEIPSPIAEVQAVRQHVTDKLTPAYGSYLPDLDTFVKDDTGEDIQVESTTSGDMLDRSLFPSSMSDERFYERVLPVYQAMLSIHVETGKPMDKITRRDVYKLLPHIPISTIGTQIDAIRESGQLEKNSGDRSVAGPSDR